MADCKTHQAALLNLQSRTARLSYVLEHFSILRRKKVPAVVVGRVPALDPGDDLLQWFEANSAIGSVFLIATPLRG